MEVIMDNKYALGSTKVAHEHHDLKTVKTPLACRFCGHNHLVYCPTMRDHHCPECDKYQEDIPAGYSTGRSANY